MSAHPALDVNAAIDAVATRKVPAAVQLGGIAAIVIGIVGFGIGMATDPAWAWGAVLVGILYVTALAFGGLAFSLVATLTWARWSRPLKRVAETFALFGPIAWLLIAIFVIVANGLYPWHAGTFNPGGQIAIEPHSPAVLFAAKPQYLTVPFFIARQVIGVGLLAGLGFIYLRASLRPDLIMAKARLGDRAPGWWGMFIGGAGDLASEVKASDRTQSNLAPFVVIAYAIIMTLIHMDLIMTLAPWWYANMFPAWLSASSFWLSMHALVVTSLVGLDWLGLRGWVKPKTTHDIGKLILAFTMAWAYMLFAQILPIWYANMPEETDFLLVRMTLPQWAWLSRTVAVLCFLMPFTVLTSRGIKKMRWPFVALLCCMMFGVFLERTVLVMPSVYHGDTFPWAQFLLTSIPVWIGFLGLFFTFVTQVLARMPALPVSDPLLEEHPWDMHVHADMAHDRAHH
jgi:hypothetical protein